MTFKIIDKLWVLSTRQVECNNPLMISKITIAITLLHMCDLMVHEYVYMHVYPCICAHCECMWVWAFMCVFMWQCQTLLLYYGNFYPTFKSYRSIACLIPVSGARMWLWSIHLPHTHTIVHLTTFCNDCTKPHSYLGRTTWEHSKPREMRSDIWSFSPSWFS